MQHLAQNVDSNLQTIFDCGFNAFDTSILFIGEMDFTLAISVTNTLKNTRFTSLGNSPQYQLTPMQIIATSYHTMGKNDNNIVHPADKLIYDLNNKLFSKIESNVRKLENESDEQVLLTCNVIHSVNARKLNEIDVLHNLVCENPNIFDE